MSTDPVLVADRRETPLLTFALLLAAVGSFGTIYLTSGLGLIACPLCFYQRAFMLSCLAVLGIGHLTRMSRVVAVSALAVPLAVSGAAVAAFHVWLQVSGKLECPAGMLGLGSAPQQSLAVFLPLTLVLAIDCGITRRPGGGWPIAVVGLVVGAAFAWGCIATAPKLRPAPDRPYDAEKEPLNTCRPPYVAKT
ncbi:MAG: disulfide bond formation protein B [Gemmataceae bacterium]